VINSLLSETAPGDIIMQQIDIKEFANQWPDLLATLDLGAEKEA
jgi:hypothetical protein